MGGDLTKKIGNKLHVIVKNEEWVIQTSLI